MLVVSRDERESVVIGADIKVTVLSVARGQVKLGIDAPDGVDILREELLKSGSKCRSSSDVDPL